MYMYMYISMKHMTKCTCTWNSMYIVHVGHGLCCTGLGLGATYKCFHRHSDILMEVPLTQEKWPCLYTLYMYTVRIQFQACIYVINQICIYKQTRIALND